MARLDCFPFLLVGLVIVKNTKKYSNNYNAWKNTSGHANLRTIPTYWLRICWARSVIPYLVTSWRLSCGMGGSWTCRGVNSIKFGMGLLQLISINYIPYCPPISLIVPCWGTLCSTKHSLALRSHLLPPAINGRYQLLGCRCRICFMTILLKMFKDISSKRIFSGITENERYGQLLSQSWTT